MQANFVGSFVKVNAWQPEKPEFCFIGRSNSGKSSLLASLIDNPSLVKTSKRPGHTQTINLFDCQEYYLVDLPGYGYAKAPDKIRAQITKVIDDYFRYSKNLKASVLTLDCRREISAEELSLAQIMRARGIPMILALTKTDKLNQKESSIVLKKITQLDLHFHLVILTSALKKKGQSELLNFIQTF